MMFGEERQLLFELSIPQIGRKLNDSRMRVGCMDNWTHTHKCEEEILCTLIITRIVILI